MFGGSIAIAQHDKRLIHSESNFHHDCHPQPTSNTRLPSDDMRTLTYCSQIEMASSFQHQPEPVNETLPAEARPRRWKLSATIGIFMCSVFVYPMLICGCHFHLIAVVPTLAPTAWSVFLLMSYRTRAERIGSWAAFGFAMLWIWAGIDSNLKFILR